MWRGRHDNATVGKPKPIEPVDLEAGRHDRGSRVAAGVTATEEKRPDGGIEQPLNAREGGSLGAHVLEEAQLSAGPKDPVKLSQRRLLVGDRTQDERCHGRIEVPVAGREVCGDAVDDLDWNSSSLGVALRDRAQMALRFNGEHAGDLGGIVREVEPVSGSHLHNAAAEPFKEALAMFRDAAAIHRWARQCVEAGEDGVTHASQQPQPDIRLAGEVAGAA